MKKTEQKSFEAQLTRLETIVEKLDRGDEELDKLLEYYEEGITLTNELRDYLKNAELKIIKISKNQKNDVNDE